MAYTPGTLRETFERAKQKEREIVFAQERVNMVLSMQIEDEEERSLRYNEAFWTWRHAVEELAGTLAEENEARECEEKLMAAIDDLHRFLNLKEAWKISKFKVELGFELGMAPPLRPGEVPPPKPTTSRPPEVRRPLLRPAQSAYWMETCPPLEQ